MKFINRCQELSRLNKLIQLPEASSVVIWGRRRIGKSRLLLEWIRQYRGVYYIADESTAPIQRKYFAMAVDQALPGFSEAEYPDWTSLLSRLGRDAMQAQWRGPIIIDELPYLIAASPELPSVLQRFIDVEANRAQLVIALCGSSQRMMQGAILAPTAPLYGRAHEILKLSPISIGYMKEALKLKTPRSVVEFYTIWGGIPYYWELVGRNGGSFLDTIDKLVLDPMGPLHEEPNRLLLEESAMNLRPILDAIGLGAHRLSEVATKIGQPITSLTRSVQRLIELDFIQKEHPYGADEVNSKRTLYKIKDPFLRFWFDVIAPKRSFLSQAASSDRIRWVQQALPRLVSTTWEELCRLATPVLSKSWDKEFYGQAGRFWRAQELEWDILSCSEDGKSLIVGEAKWLAKTPTVSFIQKLIKRMKSKGTPPISHHPNDKTTYVLFVPEKPRQINIPADVKIVDAKEVINSLR